MRFTDGYWLTRPEFEMSYATEVYQVKAGDKALRVLAATRPVKGNKGAALNMPALEVSLSSIMEGVICVEITHFKGALKPCPQFDIIREPIAAQINQQEGAWQITSGSLQALVRTGQNWQIDFMGDVSAHLQMPKPAGDV